MTEEVRQATAAEPVVDEFGQLADDVPDASTPELMMRLREIEGERRRIEAESSLVLAELERRRAHRADGHATMWGLLRSELRWSDRECRERMRLARLVERHPSVGEQLHITAAPVANLVEIARAAANPRCGEQIDDVIGGLQTSAERMEHDDLRLVVRQWELRADARASAEAASTRHDERDAHIAVSDGSTHLGARWGDIDGLSNREIFDQFVAAEWLIDWNEAVELYGDDMGPRHLARTDAQRRADALTKIFSQAASTPPGSRAPDPTVVIHVDHSTFTDIMVEAELFPEGVVDPFDDPSVVVERRRCATGNGDPVDPMSVLPYLLEGHVRFAIHDDDGVPIHWGRERRLFSGAAREAVMAQSCRCTHPGCRIRSGRSQADHIRDHQHGGPTDPGNGAPRCARHNRLKNRGFTTCRDAFGVFRTYRPDGTEIGVP